MLFIPGALIAILTFPGVIVHELAHQLFCRLRRVPVYEVKYIQAKNPSGYVAHERSDSALTNFLVGIGPFLVNNLLGILILFPASLEFALGSPRGEGTEYVLRVILLGVCYWLGLSILMHSFPSRGDAKNLSETILRNPDMPILARILAAPVVGLLYLGALGSVVWLDLLYGVMVAFLLPRVVGLLL
jgi:hypothetical protein